MRVMPSCPTLRSGDLCNQQILYRPCCQVNGANLLAERFVHVNQRELPRSGCMKIRQSCIRQPAEPFRAVLNSHIKYS